MMPSLVDKSWIGDPLPSSHIYSVTPAQPSYVTNSTVSLADLLGQQKELVMQQRRNEEVILLLQTMYPEVWRQITDMLAARDALLGRD